MSKPYFKKKTFQGHPLHLIQQYPFMFLVVETCYSIFVCVCARKRAHICTCACREQNLTPASSLSYSSPCCLRQDFSLSLEFTNSTREQATGMFLSMLPLSWDYSALLPASFVWMLRRKLRSSCLPNKYFRE